MRYTHAFTPITGLGVPATLCGPLHYLGSLCHSLLWHWPNPNREVTCINGANPKGEERLIRSPDCHQRRQADAPPKLFVPTATAKYAARPWKMGGVNYRRLLRNPFHLHGRQPWGRAHSTVCLMPPQGRRADAPPKSGRAAAKKQPSTFRWMMVFVLAAEAATRNRSSKTLRPIAAPARETSPGTPPSGHWRARSRSCPRTRNTPSYD